VGVNRFRETEPNPLVADLDAATQRVDPGVEEAAMQSLAAWRETRDDAAVAAALGELRTAAGTTANLVPATLACARAGVTTGEWADALRSVFGEYRAPTGVGDGGAPVTAGADPALADVRAAVRRTADDLGVSALRLLVGKPGLDGHSNGAEQVAVRARDAGFEVVYQGIRLMPEQIVAAAVQEDVHCVGLSILSGSHLVLVPQVLAGLRAAGAGDVPVVVGGIVPDRDARALVELGVAAVFTPKDFGLTELVGRLVAVIRAAHGLVDAAESGPVDNVGERPAVSRAGRRDERRAPWHS
jgi:(2R)-ethylmalonyl-CoA mutase